MRTGFCARGGAPRTSDTRRPAAVNMTAATGTYRLLTTRTATRLFPVIRVVVVTLLH